MNRVAVGLLLAGFCLGVSAHDLWLERSSGQYTLYHGHLLSGHEGARHIEYAPSTVKEAACFDATGAPLPAVLADERYPWRISADCATVTVLTSSGYWTKTPYGTRNVPRTEATGVVRSWLSVEGVKRVDRWSEALARPLTDALELVPLNDPLALAPGDKLRLLVAYRGRPLAGVAVAYDGETRGMSDDAGRVNVRIRHPGPQLVVASWRTPLESDLADEAIHSATLTFDLQ